MKRVILLGATGSIGLQTIDVILSHCDKFQLVAMACGKNISELEKIIKKSDCTYYNVQYKEDAIMLQKKYPLLHISYGDEGMLRLIELQADVVVNALVGFLGLQPSLHAIRQKKVLALANKESLVVGGELIKATLKEHNGIMYPIDSEHSAIFQCLQGNELKEVERIIISASGGSFRNKTREELKKVSVQDALNHPNWSMGKRITIDSATMMNKGFEVIEAFYLFDINFDKIDVIINKESIVHSLVEYVDKSILAQLGTADMRVPIQYALTYPNRITLHHADSLNLYDVGVLHFEKINYDRFPLLALAFKAGKRGGNSGAIINAADEVAIELFLEEKISFLEIETCIFKAYEEIAWLEQPTLNDLIETDKQTRKLVYDYIGGK